MVVTCDIVFENNTLGTFYAGQLISGCVTLKADKPKEVKAVLLKVYGFSLTKWTEQQLLQSKLFIGREEYLSTLTYLVGSEQNIKKHTIEPGKHRYNFACQLPTRCPTSYEGRHGCIRYLVKVILIRPWKFDQTYTRGLTVLKLIDLNFETPQLRLPANSVAYRTFCCAPCKTAPLKLEIHIPQSGYVAGQCIPVTALVINNTNFNVSDVKFALVMLVRYLSQTPKHTCVERIAVKMAKGDTVLKHSTRSLTAELLVPATPPTMISSSNIIKIAYQIEVEANVKAVHASQKMIMPVIIGTLPLVVGGVIVQQPKVQMPLTHSGKATNVELAPIGNVPNSVDISLPSYMAAEHTVKGNINEEELYAFGPNEFAPLYPVYSISSPPPVTVTTNQNFGYINASYTL